jgi:hypothetical protein
MSDDGQPKNPNATIQIDAADAMMLELDDESAPMPRRSVPPPLPPEAFLPLPQQAAAGAPARGIGRGAIVGIAVASVLGIAGGLKFGLAILRPDPPKVPAVSSAQATATASVAKPAAAPTTMQMPAVDLSEDDAGK